MGLLGHGDEDTLFADVLLPGFNAGEPVVGRRVRAAAEERTDEQIFDGLGVGKIGVQPDAITGLKVRDLGDGQRDAVAGYAHVDAGADEVKPRIDGEARREEAKQEDAEGCQTDEPPRATGHA